MGCFKAPLWGPEAMTMKALPISSHEIITNSFLNLMCMHFLADPNGAEIKLISKLEKGGKHPRYNFDFIL